MFDPREKIALFIDGANLYAAAKSLGFDIDYKRLLTHFSETGYLLRAYYYTALAEDQEYSSIRPLIDWLDYNGYTVITKPTKEFVDAAGRRKIKGNMDMELAIDVMEIAEFGRSYRPLLRRWRLPLVGRGGAAQGPQGQRHLDLVDAAADDRRRAPPSGRPFHRADVPSPDDRPRPVRAAAASGSAAGRGHRTAVRRRTRRRNLERGSGNAFFRPDRAAGRLSFMPTPGRLPRDLAGNVSRAGTTHRCPPSARSMPVC